MRLAIVIFLVGILLFFIPVSATVLHVPSQYATIQNGIDASSDGDTVEVSPGTYSGRVNFLGHRILLTSVAGPDSTVITTIPDSLPLIRFYTGEDSTTVLRGFTVEGGTGIAIGCLYSGPIIESNIIEDNANYGSYSGGHDGAGIYANQANCIIRNNIIRRNSSLGAGSGICIGSSSGIKIIGNTIISNESGTYGGGLFLISSSDCIIERNLLVGNYAVQGGGGIWFTWGEHNLIVNNTIDSNYCDPGIYASGIMLLNTDYNVLKNNIITNNYPNYGIIKRWGIPFSDTLVYSDIYGNTPADVDSVSLGVGCISSEPLYIDRSSGNYNLLPSSPCIDAGDPSSPIDPDGTTADMGAFPTYHRTIFYIDNAGNDTTGYGSETSPFKTIQHGIDISLDGDTVLVNDGYYYERINFRGKGIIVASRHLFDDDTLHIQNTIIDGDTTGRVISDTESVVCFVSGEDSTSVLRGFTIQNGLGTIDSSGRKGGGVFYAVKSYVNGPIISNCDITNNSNYGIYCHPDDRLLLRSTGIFNNNDGGIYASVSPEGGGAAVFAIDCIINDNMGPAYYTNGNNPNREMRFENCDISGNGSGIGQGRRGKYFNCRLENNIGCAIGPGIYHPIDSRRLTTEGVYYDSIVACIFRANGGGIFTQEFATLFCQSDSFLDNTSSAIFLFGDSWAKAVDCYFAANSSPRGAAIACTGAPYYIILDNCVFVDNIADEGGAICSYSSADPGAWQINATRCLFIGNHARSGGAAYIETDHDMSFSSCTFAYNYADTGSAFYLKPRNGNWGSTHEIDSCSVTFNGPGAAIYCSEPIGAAISCTDIYGNPGGDWVSPIDTFATINGNFSADPLFCDTISGDFRIRSTSPCAPANNSCNALIGALGIGCYEISDFHLISPPSDTIFVTMPDSFVWSKSREEYLGEDASYRLYFDDDSLFSSPDSSNIVADTTYYFPDSIPRSQRYYWKVMAFISQADPKFSTETGNIYLDGYPLFPVLISPNNGANADSGTALLWLRAFDPDPFDSLNYSIQVDSDSAFSSPIVDIGMANSSIINGDTLGLRLDELTGFENMIPNTNYYWRIRSNDKYGLSSTWSDGLFIFLAQISEFSLIGPDSGSILNDLRPTLIWHKASHIDSTVIISYKAYWGAEPSFTDSSGEIIDTLYQINTDLARSHSYLWQIRAYGPHATDRFSSQRDFYIDGFPTAPQIIEPPNGMLADLGTNLIWYLSTDPDSFDNVSYTIQVDDDSGFVSPEINQSDLRSGTVADDAFAIRLGELEGYENLQADMRYFWRVRADDNYGLSSDWTDGTNWFTFMAQNHPPNPPLSGFSPSDYEEIISLTPNISWDDATDPDPDDISDSLRYIFSLFSDSSMGDLIQFAYDTTEAGVNRFTVTDTLPDNFLFAYVVKTIDNGGLSSDWSARQNFWTNHYNYPPEPFLVYGPDDGEMQVVYNTQFSWGSTIDYDPNSSFAYSIQFSSDSSFGLIQRQIVGITDTAITIPTDSLALVDQQPYWRVAAIDDDSLIRIGGIPEGPRQLIILPPGDANSSGVTNGLDVTFLVSYFKGGPAPDPILAGDANGNCETNGLDVVYLVSYFKGSDMPPVRPNCEPIILRNNKNQKTGN